MQCWLSICLVQCLIISYRSFSTILYSVSVVCVVMLITTVLATHMKQLNLTRLAYNLIVSGHNSLWAFGNT